MKLSYGCAALAISMVMGGSAWAQTKETAIYSFSGNADGNEPRGALIFGLDGALYGTASSGGLNQNGTIFRVDENASTNREQTLYQFTGGADGSMPSAALLQDSTGAFYGTTALDGAGGAGTVFRLDPPGAGQTAWTETTLWSFTGGKLGGQPMGALIADKSGSGVLYGTTSFGGANGLGVVFSLTPPAAGQTAWTQQVLWSFTGGADGARPLGALLQQDHGALLGTASLGGTSGAGTVFELVPPVSGNTWAFSTIYSFTGGADGATPMASLVKDNAGIFYGTAQFGGSGDCAQPRYPYYSAPESETIPAYTAAYVPLGGNSCGVVFTLTPPSGTQTSWTQSVIWSFQAGWDGGNPIGDVLPIGGAIYGVTPEYGDQGPNALNEYGDKGNVFILTPPASPGGPYTETTTLSFTGESKGTYVRTALVKSNGPHFYVAGTFGGKFWVHVQNYGFGSVVEVHN